MTDGKSYPPPPSAVPTHNADAIVLRTIELTDRGVTMRYAECGSPIGVPVVFCHGFPEFWLSWNKQMQPLAACGYRVITPDLRGFGGTKLNKPASYVPAAADYTHKEICTDLQSLLVALKLPAAVFIGHDWGGAIVWHMARRFPKCVLAVGGVCTPFRPRSARYLSTADIAKMYPAMYYQCYFQENGAADAAAEFEADTDHTVRCFMRTSKPDDKLQQKWMTPESRAAGDGLFNRVPKPVSRSELLTASELKQFVEAYTLSGYRNALQWYCAHSLNWENEGEIPQRVEQPALMVTAGKDGVLLPYLSRDMEDWVPRLTRAHIADAGHWVQYEQATELTAVLLKWLNSLPFTPKQTAAAVQSSAAAQASAAVATAANGKAKPVRSKL